MVLLQCRSRSDKTSALLLSCPFLFHIPLFSFFFPIAYFYCFSTFSSSFFTLYFSSLLFFLCFLFVVFFFFLDLLSPFFQLSNTHCYRSAFIILTFLFYLTFLFLFLLPFSYLILRTNIQTVEFCAGIQTLCECFFSLKFIF